jgi:hypothetical protein
MKDQIFRYLEKDAPFNAKIDWISPGFKFWNLFTEAPKIHALDKLVMEYCPPAVSCERNWSSHATIHNKSCNRLKEDSAFKFTAITHILGRVQETNKGRYFQEVWEDNRCGQ